MEIIYTDGKKFAKDQIERHCDVDDTDDGAGNHHAITLAMIATSPVTPAAIAILSFPVIFEQKSGFYARSLFFATEVGFLRQPPCFLQQKSRKVAFLT